MAIVIRLALAVRQSASLALAMKINPHYVSLVAPGCLVLKQLRYRKNAKAFVY